jgi:rod shape determining protein RodA
LILQKAGERRRWGFSLGSYLLNLDWILLAVSLALVGCGMALIYSATHADPGLSSPTYWVRSQAVGLGVGLVLMIAASLIDFTRLARWHKYIYAVMVLLLVATLVIGTERMGARRWIALPFFDLQASEPAKLMAVLALAAFLADGVELRNRFRFVLTAVAYLAVPAVLVFLEPDLGTALVFVVVLFSMLLAWGIRWTHLGVLVAAGIGAVVAVVRLLPAMGLSLLKPYQIQRLLVFLDPERDTSGDGYQLSQSKIAVASGMYTGKGYMKGTQTHLNFLPAHHTDFIFAVAGEEFGFLGAMVLLGLFLVLIWRIFRIAGTSKNLFGSLIASGIAGVVVFQVFVNVGMTIGIMPVTGVPLPLVSFGSNSLVVFLTAIGVLQSIHVHSRTALYGGRLKGEAHGTVAP